MGWSNKVSIIKLFPTLVCVEENIIDIKLSEVLKGRINLLEKQIDKGGIGWYSSVYNTMNTYSVANDPVFFPLIGKISFIVEEFQKELGVLSDLHLSESWFNIYYKNDYQEYHIHPNSILSAVYFLSAPKGGSKLVLQNPAYSRKMFLPSKFETNINNSDNWIFEPIENALYVFPSYIHHMATAHNIDQKRVSLAFNFTSIL